MWAMLQRGFERLVLVAFGSKQFPRYRQQEPLFAFEFVARRLRVSTAIACNFATFCRRFDARFGLRRHATGNAAEANNAY